MRTTILVAMLLLGATLVVAPTAAAWNPWCSSSTGTSTVNWVQTETNCKIDNAQEELEEIFCDIVCNL